MREDTPLRPGDPPPPSPIPVGALPPPPEAPAPVDPLDQALAALHHAAIAEAAAALAALTHGPIPAIRTGSRAATRDALRRAGACVLPAPAGAPLAWALRELGRRCGRAAMAFADDPGSLRAAARGAQGLPPIVLIGSGGPRLATALRAELPADSRTGWIGPDEALPPGPPRGALRALLAAAAPALSADRLDALTLPADPEAAAVLIRALVARPGSLEELVRAGPSAVAAAVAALSPEDAWLLSRVGWMATAPVPPELIAAAWGQDPGHPNVAGWIDRLRRRALLVPCSGGRLRLPAAVARVLRPLPGRGAPTPGPLAAALRARAEAAIAAIQAHDLDQLSLFDPSPFGAFAAHRRRGEPPGPGPLADLDPEPLGAWLPPAWSLPLWDGAPPESLAELHLTSGDPEAALRDLGHAPGVRAAWARARALLQLARPTHAAPYLSEAAAGPPTDPAAAAARIRRAAELRRAPTAEADALRAALALAPVLRDGPSPLRGDARIALARALQGAQRPAEALALLRGGDADPDPVHRARARVERVALGDLPPAPTLDELRPTLEACGRVEPLARLLRVAARAAAPAEAAALHARRAALLELNADLVGAARALVDEAEARPSDDPGLLPLLTRAARLAQAAEDPRAYARALIGCGAALLGRGAGLPALVNFEAAAIVARSARWEAGEAGALWRAAQIERQIGQLHAAEQHARAAVRMEGSLQPDERVRARIAHARALHGLRRADDARAALAPVAADPRAARLLSGWAGPARSRRGGPA